jgi:acyl-CoA thioester hydrolase
MAFEFEVVVPYYQVDQQGVVFNMWYLAWFDEAMSAFLTSLGYPYAAMIADGLDVQLVRSEVDWRGSARWGDQARVDVTTDSLGSTSFTLAFGVRVGDEVIAAGRTVYVVISTDGTGKRPIPSELREALASAARAAS